MVDSLPDYFTPHLPGSETEYNRQFNNAQEDYRFLFATAKNNGVDIVGRLRSKKPHEKIVLAGVGHGAATAAFLKFLDANQILVYPSDVICVEPDTHAFSLHKTKFPQLQIMPLPIEDFYKTYSSRNGLIVTVVGLQIPTREVINSTGNFFLEQSKIPVSQRKITQDATGLFITSQPYQEYDPMARDDHADFLAWKKINKGNFTVCTSRIFEEGTYGRSDAIVLGISTPVTTMI